MIDLYALPPDFPGKININRNPNNPAPYVMALESAFAKDICDVRFIPHLQLHEFETMLLADPDQFAIAFENCGQQVASLKNMISHFQSIEHVNDGQTTAPSKRISQLFPTYVGRKTTAGVDIANAIGISTIRSLCPHVNHWIKQLENYYWGVL